MHSRLRFGPLRAIAGILVPAVMALPAAGQGVARRNAVVETKHDGSAM